MQVFLKSAQSRNHVHKISSLCLRLSVTLIYLKKFPCWKNNYGAKGARFMSFIIVKSKTLHSRTLGDAPNGGLAKDQKPSSTSLMISSKTVQGTKQFRKLKFTQ